MRLRLFFVIALASVSGSVAEASSSLGKSPDAFRTAWGHPSREERLTRTASSLWKFDQRRSNSLPADIAEAEVSFLDGMACQIILRSRRPLTKERIADLAKTLVPSIRKTGIPTPRTLSDGARTYALPDKGYITVWAEEKPAVMVIRSRIFLRNKEVFDREAAKVRPPTASH
jgi:hypothetical protein